MCKVEESEARGGFSAKLRILAKLECLQLCCRDGRLVKDNVISRREDKRQHAYVHRSFVVVQAKSTLQEFKAILATPYQSLSYPLILPSHLEGYRRCSIIGGYVEQSVVGTEIGSPHI
jgi:hypothetical protein